MEDKFVFSGLEEASTPLVLRVVCRGCVMRNTKRRGVVEELNVSNGSGWIE